MHEVPLNKKKFKELFPELFTNNELEELLGDAKLLGINVYKKARKLEIKTEFDRLVPMKTIWSLEHNISKIFGVDSIYIRPTFILSITLDEILKQYWNNILDIVNKKIALSRGIMHKATWQLDNNKLRVLLNTKGTNILKNRNCDVLIQDIIRDFFSVELRVEFEDISIDKQKKEEYIEDKISEEIKFVNYVTAINVGNEKTRPSKEYVDISKKTKRPKYEKRQKEQKSDILGKIFSDAIMPMMEVSQDSGTVAIAGEVFRIDIRETKSGKILYIFDITDSTSSLTVKFFTDKEELENIKKKVAEGKIVKVRGDAQYDKFSKELGVFASDIVEMPNKEIKMDNSFEKRVELHLHTQMSSMDGVASVKDYIKRAVLWGHKAIAITDHGVVQAFPDAYDASKKNDIKIIYGVECYLCGDKSPIVCNPKRYGLDEEFVVFDVETTGLIPGKDKITEIGAVKIKEGKIIEKYSSFVNPEISIPNHIIRLTGITNDMVKNAPKIQEVISEFLDFVNGSPIVAHNALFDVGFIRYEANKISVSINNPIIDTLELTRAIFTDLKKFKLNIVAKYLGIELKNHHRALDDSNATAMILNKCFEILRDKGVENIEQIDQILSGDLGFSRVNTYHAVLLVKDYIGLKNLYKIISKSHLNYFHKRPRVPKRLLTENRDGLLIGSGCEAGELYRAILEKKSEEELSKISRFYDYFEIQPLGNNQFLIENGKVSGNEELRSINKKIVNLGEKYRKPVVATCDVHFIDPKDEAYRRILMAGKGFADADNQAPLYFRTTEEMLDEFSYLGEDKAHEVVVKNTNKIADMVEKIMPIPDGTFPPRIEGSEEEIKVLSTKKAKEIYGEELPENVNSRLQRELDSIIKNGFSVMYIIAQKLVWKSLSDGYLVGSRGSVGSSFVAYLIGITEVNSLPPHYICGNCKYGEFIEDGSVGCGFDLLAKKCPKCDQDLKRDGYDIPFETFLGFDGDKEPDIDLNFSGEYQSIAHKYTEELFGEGYVYRAGTIGTIAEKTAFGFVKNYFDEREKTVTNAEINRLIRGCTGVKRTTGQHPGGVMIVPSDKNIYDFCPVQRPADDINSSIITTHFDYHSISGRLLKLDILGHDDPTVIKMLEDLTGIDARNIIMGEPETMGIFNNTKPLKVRPEDINSEVGTFAIPEFGTKFVRQMLLDTRPTTFSELIRISGLSHGTDVWTNNAHELVRDNVATLKEVICTRDDIMLYLIHSGLPPKVAFKIMEDVRKGKGLKEEYEEIMKENSVPLWYVNSCKKIKYMFPKAHAAAYVMMAFRIAWFKVHYPEAFYVTYFTVRADDFDAELMTNGKEKVMRKIKELEGIGNAMTQKEKNVLTILEVANEMYARDIKFLPVDIYESDAIQFQITPLGIRPPLNALAGLGETAAKNIVESRKGGKFLSVDELRINSKISKAVIEILKENGCLDGMPDSNQISFF